MDYSAPYHPFKSPAAKQRYLDFYDKKARHWPVPAETLTISGTYGETFVRISGVPDAPPILLIPGASVSSLMWAPVIERLSGEFRVYAVDNIYDYGRSVYRRKMTRAEDLMGWLDEVLDSLGLDGKVSLAGLSYGGGIAARYALHAPSRIAKLVLLAPVGMAPVRMQFWIRVAFLFLPFPYFKRSFWKWLFADLARKKEFYGSRASEEDEISVAMQSFKMKNSVMPSVLTDEEVAGFQVPVLFMIGENERSFSPTGSVKRLKEKAPAIVIEILKDAGHDLVFVQPEIVIEKVLQFLHNRKLE